MVVVVVVLLVVVVVQAKVKLNKIFNTRRKNRKQHEELERWFVGSTWPK
jgi:hypothetical protein